MASYLSTQPWKVVSFDEFDKQYLMKAHFSCFGYEILLSDKISLWHESVADDEFESRVQKLNPGVEAPRNVILDHLKINYERFGKRQLSVKLHTHFKSSSDSEHQNMTLTMETSLAGLPFLWKFITVPADSTMISSHLIVPLMTMVGELLRQQQELYKRLKNKDNEIEDLKAQGVKVTRKRLETEKFDEFTFKQSMTKSKGFIQQIQTEGDAMFSEDGQQLYKELMLKKVYLENESDYESLPCEDSIMMDTSSAGTSPSKTPQKSVQTCSNDTMQTAETEAARRRELEQRLAEEMKRKQMKQKKKKLKL